MESLHRQSLVANRPVVVNQQKRVNIKVQGETNRQKRIRTRPVVMHSVALVVVAVLSCYILGSHRVLASSELAQCPPEQILLPCSCTLSEIYCYNANIVRVKPIFERIGNYLAKSINATNQFIKLELNELNIPYLEANFTAGISFEIVALKNLRSLRAIDKAAFISTNNRLLQLSFEDDTSQFITETNLAQINMLINSMPSLTRLYLDAYHLEKIPKHVFTHDNLQDLSFNYNRKKKGQISVIEKEAFYYLPSLMTIDLYNHSIGHLAKDTFRFQGDSQDLKTFLFLQDNQLNSTSFEIGLFVDIQRRLIVHVGQNNLTFVDKRVFEPFFKANIENLADFGANPLRMDCRNEWISNMESRYKQILAGIIENKGEDRRVLVTLDPADYASLHCSNSNS